MTTKYMLFCGLDVGKEAHHACALDRDGRRFCSTLMTLAEFPQLCSVEFLTRGALIIGVRRTAGRPRQPGLLRPQTSRRQRHNAALICLARRRTEVL